MPNLAFTPQTFGPPKVCCPRHPVGEKLPAVMASGHGFPAPVHFENTHLVSAQSDFSRALVQSMQFLHPSRQDTLILNNFSSAGLDLFCHLLNGVAFFRARLAASKDYADKRRTKGCEMIEIATKTVVII